MDILEFRTLLENTIANARANEDVQHIYAIDEVYYRSVGRREGLENALVLLDAYIDISINKMHDAMREDKK